MYVGGSGGPTRAKEETGCRFFFFFFWLTPRLSRCGKIKQGMVAANGIEETGTCGAVEPLDGVLFYVGTC